MDEIAHSGNGTIQCDASDTGVGAVLLQGGQPICYASRALTDTERRYAQKETELLGIVWSCDKFDQYIYGRDIMTIECDHEPPKAVFKKDIHKSPKGLQRMCLALQKYNLAVQYKRGSLMYIWIVMLRLAGCMSNSTPGLSFFRPFIPGVRL